MGSVLRASVTCEIPYEGCRGNESSHKQLMERNNVLTAAAAHAPPLQSASTAASPPAPPKKPTYAAIAQAHLDKIPSRSPYFLVGSKRPEVAERREIGHDNGGVVLFIDPSLKSGVEGVSAGVNWVWVKLAGKRLAFVYLPPSYSNARCLQLLAELPPVDLVAGDFNVGLGAAVHECTRLKRVSS
ncbi:hypothetical protein BT69DRAFT_1344877 [Atractiella rhizophila]|nr:hypothetical protein BT69DRAFT_1344877 [Atractiella rhizophila]